MLGIEAEETLLRDRHRQMAVLVYLGAAFDDEANKPSLEFDAFGCYMHCACKSRLAHCLVS